MGPDKEVIEPYGSLAVMDANVKRGYGGPLTIKPTWCPICRARRGANGYRVDFFPHIWVESVLRFVLVRFDDGVGRLAVLLSPSGPKQAHEQGNGNAGQRKENKSNYSSRGYCSRSRANCDHDCWIVSSKVLASE